MFLTATLETVDASTPIHIRNVSSRGALIDGAHLPSIGTRVRLLRGNLTANGRITWSDNQQAGIEFTGSINVRAWVARVGHQGQQRVDSVVAALRHSERVSDHLQGTKTQSLHEISDTLDQVCERLAAMPNMTVELAEELVRLDVAAQGLRELATGRKG